MVPGSYAAISGWPDLLAQLMPETVKIEVSSYVLIAILVALWIWRRPPHKGGGLPRRTEPRAPSPFGRLPHLAKAAHAPRNRPIGTIPVMRIAFLALQV